MKLKAPKNPNYCFTVVKVGQDIPLEGRDRIVHKNVFGNMVITSKDQYPAGTLMLYIPVECQLSEDYCKFNNLNDNSEYNVDKFVKGYISHKKRRVRAIKLGGFESNGMLMPLNSINNALQSGSDWDIDLHEGDDFDEINGIEFCRKYIPPTPRNSNPGGKQPKQPKRISKLVDGQFRFHVDTSQLGKNINNINPDDIVSITYKLHGTSGISSKILEKRKLNWFERLLVKLGVKLQTSVYSSEGIYASRKVVKNEFINQNTQDYYKNEKDWRKMAHDSVFPLLSDGMTAYYEIVGYTPNGNMIQKGYDYGFTNPLEDEIEYQEGVHFGVYIYRLTYTNQSGQVFELTAKQVQDWCKLNGVKAVPQLYYGKARFIANETLPLPEDFGAELLQSLKDNWWYKQCTLCKSKVPSEGIVLRKEGLGLEVYKYKNFDFLQFESKQLDNNETNIEDGE